MIDLSHPFKPYPEGEGPVGRCAHELLIPVKGRAVDAVLHTNCDFRPEDHEGFEPVAPDTRGVRDSYVVANCETVFSNFERPGQILRARAEFDLWMAETVRAAKEAAWQEGFKQGGPMHDVFYDDPDAHTRNPYAHE